MSSNPYRRLSATNFPTFSRKKKEPAVPRPLQVAAILIPILVIGPVVLGLAFLANATGTYDTSIQSLKEPFRGIGEEVEGTVEGFPSWVGADSGSVEVTIWNVKSELERRFTDIGVPPSTVSCPAILSGRKDMPTFLESRYSHLFPLEEGDQPSPYISEPQGFYIALNLFNSEAVVGQLFETILTTASLLGPSNVHVSIFENGSRDKTPEAMAHFARALTVAGIAHSLRSDPQPTEWSQVDRIEQLSVFRNVALTSLLNYSSTDPPLFQARPDHNSSSPNPNHPILPTDLIFINDVFVCPSDVLELLHQRRFQEADVTCGLDFVTAPRGAIWGWLAGVMGHNYRFYDNWVTRSIEGYPLRPRFDLFGELRDGMKELFTWDADPLPRLRFEAGLPTQVYSCFDGMAAYSAQPFLPKKVGGNEIRFRNGRLEEGECAQSECTIIAADFWAANRTRWVLVPRIALTYEPDAYSSDWMETRVRRGGAEGMTNELEQEGVFLKERIDWEGVKAPEKVVCWANHKGPRLEMWPFYETSPALSRPPTSSTRRPK